MDVIGAIFLGVLVVILALLAGVALLSGLLLRLLCHYRPYLHVSRPELVTLFGLLLGLILYFALGIALSELSIPIIADVLAVPLTMCYTLSALIYKATIRFEHTSFRAERVSFLQAASLALIPTALLSVPLVTYLWWRVSVA